MSASKFYGSHDHVPDVGDNANAAEVARLNEKIRQLESMLDAQAAILSPSCPCELRVTYDYEPAFKEGGARRAVLRTFTLHPCDGHKAAPA